MKTNKKIKLLIIPIILSIIIIPACLITNPVIFKKKSKQNIPVDTSRLYADIEKLTMINPARSYHSIESLNEISEYIYNEFDKLDCEVSYQNYTDTINNLNFRNVIASFNTDKKKRVIIGAHYDAFSNLPGADDNASGIAGLLEIARLIDELNPNLEYRLDFVAYSTEEPPYFGTYYMGSYIHANYLKENKAKIKLMVCLEMIGYYSDRPKSQRFPASFLKWFYPDKGNYIVVVSKLFNRHLVKKFKKNMSEVSNIDVRSLNAPSFIQSISLSDHRNYWNFGYKAIMITNTAYYRNRNYHKVGDQIETLDFAKMAEVIRGVYWAVVNE